MIAFIKNSTLVLFTGVALLTASCSDTEKKPEEAVTPSSDVTPATPPALAEEAAFTAETVHFAYDRSSVTAEGQVILAKLAEHLKSNPTAKVRVEGNCDERGTVEYNLALGERRALAAKKFLISLGVSAARISTISYGEENPVATGHDSAAWAKNRRDDFVISSN